METSVPFGAYVELLIYLFITLAMFCIGLQARLGDFGALLRDRARTLRVVFANVVVPLLVAILLATIFQVPESVATVLFLLALAPGGINAVQFSTKVPGQLALSGELLFFLSIVGLVTAPVAAWMILPADASVGVPAGELAFRVLGLVTAPLVIGMTVRSTNPSLAERLYKPAMLVSTISFVASVVLSLSQRQESLSLFGSPTVMAMLLFVVALMATGWLAGGPELDRRQVLAVATNLRNVGLVYVLVEGCCEGGELTAAVLGFMALMVPANLVLTILCAVARKKRSPA